MPFDILEKDREYQTGKLKKGVILQRLREKGCRITKQREILIDVILQENCTCCKEIYYLAMKKDPNIGMATIYRMVNLLEEIGALERRSQYKIYESDSAAINNCLVELDDSTKVELKADTLHQILQKGMESCGYLEGQKVKQIVMIKA